MEYVEDEICNKTVSDVVNCSIEYQHYIESTSAKLRPEAIAVPLTFAIIFVLGMVGNVLLILNFARHKKLSTTHNALVVNLALGDLLMLMVGLPFNSVLYTVPYWPFGDVICRVSRFVETVTTAVTICTLTVLSVERLRLVVGPRRYQSLSSITSPCCMLLAVWVISICLGIPDIISATVVNMPISPTHVSTGSSSSSSNADGSVEGQGQGLRADFCFDFDPTFGKEYAKAIILSKFIVLFCVPLFVIGPCYIWLALHLFFRMFTSRTKTSLGGPGSSPNLRTPLAAATAASSVNPCQVETASPRVSNTEEAGVSISGDNTQRQDNVAGNEDCPAAQDQDKLTAPVAAVSDPNSPLSKASVSSYASCNTALVGNAGNSSVQHSAAMKQRRLAFTVLGLVGVFILCWLPRHIYLLWYHFSPALFDAFWHVFKITAFCLLFANSALNPYVFYFLDLRFRAFVHAILCCRKRGRGQGRGGEEGRTTGGGLKTGSMMAAETTAVEDRKTQYIAMQELPPATAGKIDHV